MHIISRRRLKEYADEHADAARPLDDWYDAASRADWQSIQDVRQVFPHADGGVKVRSGRNVTVFNIGGNAHRLITDIHYNRGKVYILMLMTHATYGKNHWKGEL